MYLVDLQGNVEHTWQMPYPGIYGYLTERGTLFYNGRQYALPLKPEFLVFSAQDEDEWQRNKGGWEKD